jgi:hypothetical protein
MHGQPNIKNCCFVGISLYDYSGLKLDTNSYQLLDYCGNQLHHLTTLFQGVLKMCKYPIIPGNKFSFQVLLKPMKEVYNIVKIWTSET